MSGLPGSEKSTLGRGVAARLQIPLLDKDVILESLFDSLGWGTETQRHALSRAADSALLAVADENGRGVLVNWWHHDSAPRQLATLGGRLVEVFCDCPAPVAAQRFTARRRHPGHLDPEPSASEVATRVAPVERAFRGPLHLGGPLLTVDTTRAVDLDALTGRLRSFSR